LSWSRVESLLPVQVESIDRVDRSSLKSSQPIKGHKVDFFRPFVRLFPFDLNHLESNKAVSELYVYKGEEITVSSKPNDFRSCQL